MNAHEQEQDMPDEPGECKAERISYIKFYQDDWMGGTRGFSLEQEGFYLRFIVAQWQIRGGLPDDARWIANALHCDVRTVPRMRAFLIDRGKIVCRDGFLYNPRVMRDLAKLKKREPLYPSKSVEKRGAPASTSTEDRPEIDLRSPRSSGDLFQKPNEINGGSDIAIAIAITREEREEPSALQQDAERGQADEDLISDLKKWVPPERARACLDAMVADYGRRGVRRGHDRLRQHMARGKPVRDPPGLWLAMCRRMRDEDDGSDAFATAEQAKRNADCLRVLAMSSEEVAAEHSRRYGVAA